MAGQYVTIVDQFNRPLTLSSTSNTTVVAFPAIQAVSATSLPLPANAAQEAGGHLESVDSKLVTTVNGLKVDGSAVTQPVSGTLAISNFPVSQAVTGLVSAAQSGVWNVGVNNFPVTQTVIGSGSFTVAQGSASNLLATVTQGPAGVAPWKVDGSAVTQPVSGTVGVNNFPTTQAVSGTVTTNAGTGNFTVVQATGTNLHAVIDSGSVTVSNFPATQPVSGAISVSNLAFDSTGAQAVNFEGRKQSYRCAVVAGTPIASSTSPTFSIAGSATKTVRITKIGLSTSAATGTACDAIVRRFSALSGGTSASQAGNIAKLDTNNAAATTVIATWSVAATTATSAGILASQRYEIVTAAVSVQPGVIFWLFGDNNTSACVLRGTSDFIGVCLSAVGTTPIYDIWVEFTEE